MSSSIKLSSSDMKKLSKLTALLNVNIQLSVWLDGVYQASWKKEATSYMWRSNTNSVEIVHHGDYDNMTVHSLEELINSLRFVGA